MIRVALVDDQVLLRRGLRGLLELEPSVEVVGEASDGDEAIAMVRETRPDVLLLDVRLPALDGIQVLQVLANEGLQPPTILLTTFDDDAAFLEGAVAGAKAFLLKDVSLEVLTQTITRVAAGETLLGPAVDERVLRGLRALGASDLGRAKPDRLTRREVEVLRLMAAGRSNREIADVLCLSEGTVKNHASSTFTKLGVRDRTQAVLKALALQWI